MPPKKKSVDSAQDVYFPSAGIGKDGYILPPYPAPVPVTMVMFQAPLSLGGGFTSNTLDLSQGRHKAVVRAMELDPATQVLTLHTTDSCGIGKGRDMKISPSFWAFYI